MEKELSIKYVKSPEWRVIAATGAAINGIGSPTGFRLIVRFTTEWVDIQKESLLAEVVQNGGQSTITVKKPPTYETSDLFKIEEAAVQFTAAGAAGLIIALIGQLPFLPDEQKQKIRAEMRKSLEESQQ